MTKSELYMYRLTAELAVEEKILDFVVLASSDEQAFDYAMQELERSWLPAPKVREWLLEEKKRVRQGAGYVFGHGQ